MFAPSGSAVASRAVEPAALEAADAEQAAADAALVEARTAVEASETTRAATGPALTAARERRTATDTVRAKLAAEARALSEVLAVKDGERWPPMVDALMVPAGLETALGAALGEELTSAADRDAARHWRELPPFDPAPALPEGATPLAGIVQGPPALARALSQIGLVEDDAAGESRQAMLAPGQVLVTRAGAVWRWDGYTIHAGTPTAAAVRLQQRNRLLALQRELITAEQEAESARVACDATAEADNRATTAEQQARAVRGAAERRLEQARTSHQHLSTKAAESSARLAAIDTQMEHVAAERTDAGAALAQAREAQTALPDLAVLRSAVEHARAALSGSRSVEASARADRETLNREHASRMARRAAITMERETWSQRAADANRRHGDLVARREAAEGEHATLREVPAQIAARRAEALDALEAAEAAHRTAADRLTAATTISADADRAARAAEAALAASREDAVRAEGAAGQAEIAWTGMAERIIERLGENPAMPDPPADLTPGRGGEGAPPARAPAEGARGDGAGQPPRRRRSGRGRKADRRHRRRARRDDHRDRQTAGLDRASEPRGPGTAGVCVRAHRPQFPVAVQRACSTAAGASRAGRIR